MNRTEAMSAIGAILEALPESELPNPSRVEKDSDEKYGDCYWFGGHGYYAGSCRDGNGNSIRADHRQSGIWSLLERERMQRIEDAHWAKIEEAAR